jgi:hypothetical protein
MKIHNAATHERSGNAFCSAIMERQRPVEQAVQRRGHNSTRYPPPGHLEPIPNFQKHAAPGNERLKACKIYKPSTTGPAAFNQTGDDPKPHTFGGTACCGGRPASR